MTIKIMVVFGTRPEAIKMAPICHLIKDDKKFFKSVICLTGQHREMLDQVMKTFNLTADIDLNIMKKKQDLTSINSLILVKMNEVLKKIKPDMVLVHGDTTTAFATSLACFYNNILVAHVEAGLRTNNISSPYPEEFNRQMVSKIADIHFAPTYRNVNNLLLEGIKKNKILLTGNTVIDSLYWIIKSINNNKSKKRRLTNNLLKKLTFNFEKNKFVLITGHRRENFGPGLIQICKAIKILAKKHSDIHFIYPLHMNPSVQVPVKKSLGNIHNVHLIKPLEYETFILLLYNCYFVLTDSGGIQEEAPSLGKPVLVMRETTERPEAIIAGTVKLVGTDTKSIVKNSNKLINNKKFYNSMTEKNNPYGKGNSSIKIINYVKKYFNGNKK
jgi:UDP-N-acetylglucosamine 2-epimerase (non-hydrolysing)